MIKIIKIQIELLLRHNTSLANESELQMNHDLSRYSCWIHCTFTNGSYISSIASMFPVFRLAVAMVGRLQAASCFVERER